MKQLGDLCGRLFQIYLKDEGLGKFRRMLAIEQYANPHAAYLYRKMFIDDALTFHTRLFSQLMKNGVLRSGDPI